jgi:hypothetical protein
MSEAKPELCVSLRTDSINSAVDHLRDVLSAWHRRNWDRLPGAVLVSFEQAQILRHLPVDHTSASAWDRLGEYCAGLGIELIALEPVCVVARYQAEIPVPGVPDSARRDLWRHWGYQNGHVNRPARYPGEPAEYGLSGELVPAKWPEPPGLQDAGFRVAAGQRQIVTVELLSDGTRRIVPETA